jgi:hypothetical protein
MSSERLLWVAAAVSVSAAAAACAGAAIDDARPGVGSAPTAVDTAPAESGGTPGASAMVQQTGGPDAGPDGVEVATPGPTEVDAGARSAGILGVLGGTSSGVFGSPFGDEGAAASLEAEGDRHAGAYGAGGLGIGDGGLPPGFGSGGGLGGSSFGRLGGARPARPPRVTSGKDQVQGALPKEVIQRIVRQHMGRIRGCYESALVRLPALAGTLAVHFTIERTGKVAGARTEGGELSDAEMVACVQRTFASMVFPAPEGSVVSVRYPLIFQPGDDTAAAGGSGGGVSAPTHLGGKPIAGATLADLQAALRAVGWTVPSFTRRPTAKAAAAIVDLEAVKDGLRARIVFHAAVREGGPPVAPEEKAHLFVEGAVTDLGGFYLAVVIDADRKQAEPLRASLFACCRAAAATGGR